MLRLKHSGQWDRGRVVYPYIRFNLEVGRIIYLQLIRVLPRLPRCVIWLPRILMYACCVKRQTQRAIASEILLLWESIFLYYKHIQDTIRHFNNIGYAMVLNMAQCWTPLMRLICSNNLYVFGWGTKRKQKIQKCEQGIKSEGGGGGSDW